jgi:hypothetical protein
MGGQMSATTIKVSSESREEITRATLRVSGLLGVRLTQETVIMAALAVANRHAQELTDEIKKGMGK